MRNDDETTAESRSEKRDVGDAVAIRHDTDGVFETAVARDDDDANGEHHHCRTTTHGDETAVASRGEDGGVGDVSEVRDDPNGVLHRRCDTEGASIARRNGCVRCQSLPRKAGASTAVKPC